MVQTARRELTPMDLPLPEIDDDSGLLRIDACGICGSDYEQFEGALPVPMPVVPGHEPLGTVAAIGDGSGWTQILGDLPGGDFESVARAVSADGAVVVGEGNTDGGRRAFLWDQENGLQQLDVLLASLGLDLTGWELYDATGISADGKTVVGYGASPNGGLESWIAVIPEPSTALLEVEVQPEALLLRAQRRATHARSPES